MDIWVLLLISQLRRHHRLRVLRLRRVVAVSIIGWASVGAGISAILLE